MGFNYTTDPNINKQSKKRFKLHYHLQIRMKSLRTLLITTIIILILAIPVIPTDAPVWTGNYVNDYAGILSNSGQLESILQELQQNNTVEFAIVTINQTPPDETKETYANKIFNKWGIGKKGENNGLLFLMISNQTSGNRMRLEIGYGLEPYITDSAAGRILDAALPYYEKQDYSKAAYIVVTRTIDILNQKNYQPGPEIRRAVEKIDWFPIIFFLVYIGFFVAAIIISIVKTKPRCPECDSAKLRADGEYYICKKCGHRFKKPKAKRAYPFIISGSGASTGGGSFGGGGGFGGGGSGGGGAGR